MSVYEYKAVDPRGQEISLNQYAGKVLLIANTASQCGLTPQYGELQQLYDQYSQQGLEILGFPCNQFGGQEPGTSEEAESFCQLNYGVSFQIFGKVDVNGEGTHPLFQYLKSEQPGPNEDGDIAWNFTKFLVDREGKVIRRFEPRETPESMKEAIESLLD
ncbi:glutathione peroxidase [Bacillus sp. FJAT-18019]|nr:glutathione peroxidase [Bacillus sp. FJAT-18019]